MSKMLAKLNLLVASILAYAALGVNVNGFQRNLGFISAALMQTASGARLKQYGSAIQNGLQQAAVHPGFQCPIDVPEALGGDPSRRLCCKNGASMFEIRGYKLEIPSLGRNDSEMVALPSQHPNHARGCNACEEAAARFNVIDPVVKVIETELPPKVFGMKLHGPINFTGSYMLEGDNNITLAAHFSLYDVTSYADLEPKTADPLYISGKFNPKNQYVLFLYTSEEADHNGVFGFSSMRCQRLNCWAQRGFEVVLKRVKTKDAAKAVLDEFHDDSIHHVVLSGHGAPGILQWGHGREGLLIAGDGATESFLLKLREKIKIDGTVTLDACSNAKDRSMGLQNLFEYVASKLPGRQVTGSQVLTSADMWTQVQETGNLREIRDVEEDADADVDEIASQVIVSGSFHMVNYQISLAWKARM